MNVTTPLRKVPMCVLQALLLVLTMPLAGVVAGATVANDISHAYSEYPPPEAVSAADKVQVQRGEYLVKLGDCMACHTDIAQGGAPFAGGLRIDTPFGALFVPNITPDRTTGIGAWTADDFVQAMRQGISPDGGYYYPVFPYNYYNRMSREDILAIKAYLDHIPAVSRRNRTPQMKWPFNYRWLQFGWRLLFFDFSKGEYVDDPQKSPQWNRGAFIVEGPGHCALCHTELNLLGVPKKRSYLAGAFVQDYYAPDITSRGLQHLPPGAVADIFMRDLKPTGGALLGPMNEVEHNSLRYLRHTDMLAIAGYLKTVQSAEPPVEGLHDQPMGKDAGRKLYESNCALCHENGLGGAPKVENEKIRQILLDQGRRRLHQIAIKGSGPMPPKGGCHICSAARVEAATDYLIDHIEGGTLP